MTLVLVREQEGASWHGYEHLPHLHVRPREQALAEHYDIAIATWWETTFTLFELSAERHAYFIQSLEDRFYRHDEAERMGAGLTLDLPVVIHHRGLLDRRDARRHCALTHRCYLVRNGIDKDVFSPPEQAPVNADRPTCGC